MAIDDFVTIRYRESTAEEDAFDWDTPKSATPAEVEEDLYVCPADLYTELQEVIDGNRPRALLSVTDEGENWRITPNIRYGRPFTLPKDPERFAEVSSGWDLDTGTSYKRGLHDRLFAISAA